MSYITRTGAVLLNPAEKSRKYAIEIKHKKALTNDGKRKLDLKTGRTIKLTNEQLAYRSGYLTAMSDSQKAYKSKHPNYRRKTTKKR